MAETRNPNEPAPLVQQYAAGQTNGQVQQANGGVVQQKPVTPQQPVAVQPPQAVNVFGGTGNKPSWASLNLHKPVGIVGNVSNGVNGSNVNNGGVAPVFRKDESKRDGGFFGWLGGLVKKRNGKRAGETDDEYDERMTRNNMRMATLADALRHMGNIYNTMKGGPVQQFNSPASMYEQGLEKRRAERKADAAAKADAYYKAAQMKMKQDAAASDRAYKAMNLELKNEAGRRAEQNAKAQADMAQKQFEYRQQKDNSDMEYRKGRDKVKDSQWAANNALGWYRATHSKSGSGSSGGGSGKGVASLTNLATPSGHINRKKDLNAIEKKQLKDYLYKNGYITKSAAQKYDYAANEQERGAILNGWIGWAANAKGSAGWKFRKHLQDHYGYTETQTVPQGGGQKKSASAPKASPIRWQGSGTNTAKKKDSKGTKASGTDWSQYVK